MCFLFPPVLDPENVRLHCDLMGRYRKIHYEWRFEWMLMGVLMDNLDLLKMMSEKSPGKSTKLGGSIVQLEFYFLVVPEENPNGYNYNGIYFWFVVWNMNFVTFHPVGKFIIRTDEPHHFSEV
jgi:hypothetical protein